MLTLPLIVHETSGFGFRRDPLGGGIHLHAGIDVAAPTGAPVVSAGRGEVLRSSWAGGYGNLVVIDHGAGLTTRYAHLERSLVHAGQDIGAGQQIGLVGATGHATGSHLHFEIRKSGVPLDPLHATMTCAYSDAPSMAPALGGTAARSEWTAPRSGDALPTIVLR